MARRSPLRALTAWLARPAPRRPRLGVEVLEDRTVPTAYQVAALPADFPTRGSGLTADGFYNGAGGISRLNTGVVVPTTDFPGALILLERSYGDVVVFSVSTADTSKVLYKTVDGQPGGYHTIDIGGPTSYVGQLTFLSDTPGNLSPAFYTRAHHIHPIGETSGGPNELVDDGLWLALPDGDGGLHEGGAVAGGGFGDYEVANNVVFDGIGNLTVYAGALFFNALARDPAGHTAVGLYAADTGGHVTAVGEYPAGAQVRHLYPTSAGLLAEVATADDGAELYVGTELLKDINPGPADSTPFSLYDAGGVVYFMADDGTHGFEPWLTNGTTAGTGMLKDVNPGPASSTTTGNFAGAGGHVYFAAAGVGGATEFGPPTGVELWTTDGSEAGTRLVKDINPGSGDGISPFLFADGTDVLFAATTGQVVGGRTQFNLWQSDGTAAGTRLVHDFAPDGQYDPKLFFRFGNAIHFETNVAGTTGVAPWQVVRVSNRAPVLAQPPSDQHALPGQPFAFTPAAGTFTDPDFDTLTLTATRGDGTALSAWLTYDPITRTFSGTPSAATDLGVLAVTVTARDPDGAAVVATFNVYVDGLPNHPPTVRTPVPDVQTQIGFQVIAPTPADTFADADIPAGDALTLTLTRTDGQPLPAWLNFFSGTLVGTPPLGAYPATTAIPLRVTATDRTGAAVASDFTLTVVVPVRPAPAVVYVDRSFFTQTPADPDGDGPATEYLYDGFDDLQQALDAVALGGAVVVRTGFYFGPRGGQGGEGGQGFGTISNHGKAVTVALGSGAAGDDAGLVTVLSPLVLDSHATLRIDLAATAPAGPPVAGTDFDAVNTFGGPVTLGGATLELVGGYAYRAGDTFTLVSAVTGQFGAVVTTGLTPAAGTPTVDATGGAAVLTFAPAAPPSVVGITATPPAPAVGQTATLSALVVSSSAVTYAWSLVAAPAGSATRLSDPAATTPALTPDVPGTYQVRLVVTDALGQPSEPQTASVTVVTPPPPAVTGIGADPAQPVTGQSTTLTAATTPATGLTYTWTLVAAPGGSQAVLSDPHAPSPTLTPDLAGTYQIGLVVTDALGRTSDPVTLSLAVGPETPPPVVTLVGVQPGQPVVGQTTTLIAETAPAAGLTYTWALLAAPAGSLAVLSDPHAATPTLTPDAAGDYQVQVVVTDGAGRRSEPATVSFTVSSPPTVLRITADPEPVPVGRPTTLSATTSPAAGLRFTWSLVAAPPGSAARLSDPRSPSPTLTPDVAGRYRVRLVVTDALGHASPAVEAAVAAVPPAPRRRVVRVDGPTLTVAEADGPVLFRIPVFGGTFSGPFNLAVGDLTDDGTDDVAVAAADTGAPRVAVYDGATGLPIQDFFAYSPGFRGGASVAVVNGELATGAGAGGSPHVKLFRRGTEVASFFAFASAFRGGVTVAAGDVDGDGHADLVAVPGAGGGPVALVFDGVTGELRATFFVGPNHDDRGGVRAVLRDPDGDGRAEVLFARVGTTTRAYDPLTEAETTGDFTDDELAAVFGRPTVELG